MTIETFIGLLILACISAYFVWRNNFKTRQANASAEFRMVFDADFTFTLYNNFTTDKLRVVFDSHNEAVRIFDPYVSSFNRNSFDKAWENYEQWVNGILTDSKHTSDGVYALTLIHESRSVKTEFKNHIESLLKFANHK